MQKNLNKPILSEYSSPSIWRRFMSMFYEGFLLIGPIFFIVFLYLFIFSGTSDTTRGVNAEIIQIIVFFTLVLYFTWGWSNGRVTLPMRTLSLKVVTTDEKPVNINRALLRVLIAIPSVVSGIWILYMLFRKDNLCPHDIWSGTKLVHISGNNK